MGPTDNDHALLAAEMNSMTWVHSIDLGNGLKTPGRWGDHNPVLVRAIRDVDFTGKKVLDIGCWDGLFSFEAEKRGAAEVYATDLVSQRRDDGPTFRFAQRVLGSKARYHPNVSVYDIESLGVGDFDVVLFLGVYYHLKDPLRAFSALRRVMRDGAIIVIEGAIFNRPGCFANFFYKEKYFDDATNWFVPTVECLRQWVECNYFQIEREYERWGEGDDQRHVIVARAVRRVDPLYRRPDPELAQFNSD